MALCECERCGNEFRPGYVGEILCTDCKVALRRQECNRFMYAAMIVAAFIWIALLLFIEWRRTDPGAPWNPPTEELPAPPEPKLDMSAEF
jgi:hypothetical protein